MIFKCILCNHEWKGRGKEDKKPKACPRCKRYDWDKVEEKKDEKN